MKASRFDETNEMGFEGGFNLLAGESSPVDASEEGMGHDLASIVFSASETKFWVSLQEAAQQ